MCESQIKAGHGCTGGNDVHVWNGTQYVWMCGACALHTTHFCAIHRVPHRHDKNAQITCPQCEAGIALLPQEPSGFSWDIAGHAPG